MAKKAASSAAVAAPVAAPVAPVATPAVARAAKRAAKKAAVTTPVATPVAAPVAPVVAPVVEKERPGLTGNEIKIMGALRVGGTMDRAQLSEATGIAKGWSKTLGAATSAEGVSPDSLEGRGFITSSKVEGVRRIQYTITATGLTALVNAERVVTANAAN